MAWQLGFCDVGRLPRSPDLEICPSRTLNGRRERVFGPISFRGTVPRCRADRNSGWWLDAPVVVRTPHASKRPTPVTPGVTFLASHLEPRFGLEKAIQELIAGLARTCDVHVVVVADTAQSYVLPDARVRVTSLGGRLRGAQRWRMRRRIRRWARTETSDIV